MARIGWRVLSLVGTAVVSCGRGEAPRASTAAAVSGPSAVIVLDHTPALGTAPLLEQLDATTSTCPGTWCASFDWDFGDGTPHSSAGWVMHTYAASGTYVATLTVRDGAGRTGTASQVLTVTGAAGDPPCWPAAWEYRPAPGTQLGWEGASDVAGNLYFVECLTSTPPVGMPSTTCDLVSLDRAGKTRWRATSPVIATPSTPGGRGAPVVMGGLALVVDRQDIDVGGLLYFALTAYRTGDGTVAWTRPLFGDVLSLASGDTGGGVLHGGRPSFGNDSVLFPVTWARDAAPGPGAGVLRYDLATGALLAATRTDAAAAEVLVDASGNAYLDGWAPGGGAALRGYAPDLTPLPWTTFAPSPPQLWGVAAGQLFTSYGGAQTFGTSDGIERWARRDTLVTPVMSGATIWAVGCAGTALPCSQWSLHALDAATGATRWQRPIGSSTATGDLGWLGPVLEASGAVLLATQPAVLSTAGAARLHEFAADGTETLRCALPGSAGYQGAMSLSGGVLTLAARESGAWVLRAWDAHGRALSTNGWVTERGNLGRSNRER